jgi:DTW domain-containing protein YfiP
MKTVGTVRIVKLSIPGSLMIRGHGSDFDQDPSIARLLSHPDHHAMILYPGESSLNLSRAAESDIQSQIPRTKRLVVFVIDGTWSAAKNMIRKSTVLTQLPKLSFDVITPSTYTFRRQPQSFCLSTVEAVSALIENLKQRDLCHPEPSDGHLRMTESFQKIISSQLGYEITPKHREKKRYRRGSPLNLDNKSH